MPIFYLYVPETTRENQIKSRWEWIELCENRGSHREVRCERYPTLVGVGHRLLYRAAADFSLVVWSEHGPISVADTGTTFTLAYVHLRSSNAEALRRVGELDVDVDIAHVDIEAFSDNATPQSKSVQVVQERHIACKPYDEDVQALPAALLQACRRIALW